MSSELVDKPGIGYEQEYHSRVYGWLHEESAYRIKSQLLREVFFPMILPDHKVFEYGLGTGVNLAGLPARTREGYDVSEYARNFAQQRGITIYSHEDEIPRACYDYVISSHCLEHLEQPAANLRFLRELLARDGRLILVLPIEKHARPAQPNHMDVHQHLYGWSFRTIDNLLIHCGYSVLENCYLVTGLRAYKLLRHRSRLFWSILLKLDTWMRPRHMKHLRIIAKAAQA